MSEPNFYLQAEQNFRRLLATGKPVALEDALKDLHTPEGFDRRTFGHIVLRLLNDGEIVEHSFRRSNSSKHNSAVKRLWIATELFKPNQGKGE